MNLIARIALSASFIFLMLCTSCKNDMREIQYGEDNCELCRMTVMNPQFAAGLLTSKGKVYTFDAGECLVRYLKANGVNEKDQYFMSDYNKPGTLIDARKAAYLHGDSIQSPMGGNLAAFSNLVSAQVAQKELGGDLLTWQQLIGK
ncbi:MAG: nitrous oxide reductase accessory protein NosL [Bacteroidales bacterium]|nr:nitrous oxide reductase accessory protein NosL [Bacteroidales bacterium]MBK9358267.1 nitrous oxide reductase accessory protein NosL [Bacteroidales bacterium]